MSRSTARSGSSERRDAAALRAPQPRRTFAQALYGGSDPGRRAGVWGWGLGELVAVAGTASASRCAKGVAQRSFCAFALQPCGDTCRSVPEATMKSLVRVVAGCALALVLMGGCNKQQTPAPTAVPPPAQPAQTAPASPPTSATAPMPAPAVPTGTDPSGPKPGQVNDHSSPAFKDGGKEEKVK